MARYVLTSLGGRILGLRIAITVPSGSFHSFSCTEPKRKRLTVGPLEEPMPTVVRSVRRQMEKILLFRLRRGGILDPIIPTRTVVSDCRFVALFPEASRTYWSRLKTRRLLVRVSQISEDICGRL